LMDAQPEDLDFDVQVHSSYSTSDTPDGASGPAVAKAW
jgi:hypothetical protein